MHANLDPALSPSAWTALSFCIAACAAWLAFAWIEQDGPDDPAAKRLRQLAAGVSLGTGIWSTHAIAASKVVVGFAVGYNPWAEFAVWLLAVVVSTVAFGAPRVRRARVAHWLQATFALGSVVFALQMLGLMCGGWKPGIEWRAGMLLLAWLTCVPGCLVAFGLMDVLRRKGASAAAWGRASAGLIMGAAAVLCQHLLQLAANLPSQNASIFAEQVSPGTLTALALLGSGTLLLALQLLLRRHKRILAARLDARRERAPQVVSDPLTGLPNRQLFEDALAQTVRQADANRRRVALLLINLDSFKPINQSFGHSVGDQVLCEVAARLRAFPGPHLTARLAGDEFLMLLTGDPQPEDASALAAAVLTSVARPLQVVNREMSISCSIGVAMYPEHGAMSALIGHADAAMRAAKEAGGASHALFAAGMINGSRDGAELLRDLRVALARGQLELYYQPKIHAPSGEITGAEALMRWHHPQRGMVSPVVFIPIAERYGLIGALGRWVIDEACRQARAWRDSGLRMRVAINLSVHQLRQADLAEQIGAALLRHQINPNLITCELTESAAMDDTDLTTRVLGQLASVGVHISIDDFGTGHSSLSYLRKLPAHELKIDRSFVLDLETSEDARMVASAVINLAKALHMQVVAEGVETEAQNMILREFGCDQLQGFLFARPMSAQALTMWAMDDVGPRPMNFRDSLFVETAPAELY